LLGMRDILKEVRPDLVFVHGDTTTSAIAALAAFYQQIPVAHIEAGLRTHNIYNPWPEEMNRLLTGRLATYHFAPTQLSKQNLIHENVKEKSILVTGNTVIDALHWVVERIETQEGIKQKLENRLLSSGYDVSRVNPGRRLILITGHRRENFGDGLLNICMAIKNLALKYPQLDFVYPVHLNPNVQKTVTQIIGDKSFIENVFLIKPLDYLPFIFLMSKAYLLLTDSGGIQEEAPGIGKPVLVTRDTTERPEAVDAGTVVLVGTDRENIEKSVSKLIENVDSYMSMSNSENPYGDGKASQRIVTFFIKNVIN